MKNQNEIKQRLNAFRNSLPKRSSQEELMVFYNNQSDDGRRVTFNENLHKLNEYVFSRLEKWGKWCEIEQILNLLEENRSYFAFYVIDFALREQWGQISPYLNQVSNPMDVPPLSLFNMPLGNAFLSGVFNHTFSAGFTVEQAQRINEAVVMSEVRSNEAYVTALKLAQVDILKNMERQSSKEQKSEAIIPIGENDNFVSNKIDYQELASRFINDKTLVRIRTDEDYVVYYWSESKKYIPFSSNKSLITDLNTYAYKLYGAQIEVAVSRIDSLVNQMINHEVPLLGEGSFAEETKDRQLFFRNGYYDFNEGKFFEMDTRRYFHVFCLPYDFTDDVGEPEVFDKFLNYVFEDDLEKITLVYQIIGAIISTIPMKYIFVFQGVSHGGKSILSEFITRLFDDTEIKEIGGINEINESKAKPYERKIRFLRVDDAPNDKWSSSTVSYLKTRSRGMSNKSESTFKILLCTNYSILFKTEDGRDESMEGRMVIVPFEKNLNTISKSDCRFNEIIEKLLNGQLEQEKISIVKKALTCFGDVLSNREFVCRYQLNKCVMASKLNVLNEFVEDRCTISDKNRNLIDWLRDNFEIAYNEEEFTTAEQILEFIKRKFPETTGRVNDVGRVIKSVFGDKACNGKRSASNKICYRIKFKVLEG